MRVYYSEPGLRAYLTSWAAHNGPHLLGPDFPRRLGAFLWQKPHAQPLVLSQDDQSLKGWLELPAGKVERTVRRLSDRDGWQIDDAGLVTDTDSICSLAVNWQFAPGCEVAAIRERHYRITRDDLAIELEVSAGWTEAAVVDPRKSDPRLADYLGTCAPAFRSVAKGPMIRLRGPVNGSCVLRTTFLASSRT